jgi:hypothetical protein
MLTVLWDRPAERAPMHEAPPTGRHLPRLPVAGHDGPSRDRDRRPPGHLHPGIRTVIRRHVQAIRIQSVVCCGVEHDDVAVESHGERSLEV